MKLRKWIRCTFAPLYVPTSYLTWYLIKSVRATFAFTIWEPLLTSCDSPWSIWVSCHRSETFYCSLQCNQHSLQSIVTWTSTDSLTLLYPFLRSFSNRAIAWMPILSFLVITCSGFHNLKSLHNVNMPNPLVSLPVFWSVLIRAAVKSVKHIFASFACCQCRPVYWIYACNSNSEIVFDVCFRGCTTVQMNWESWHLTGIYFYARMRVWWFKSVARFVFL